jgi:DnaJ domain.
MTAALLSFLAMAALAILGRAASGGLPLSDALKRRLGWGGLALALLLLLGRQVAVAATVAGLAAVLLIQTPGALGGGGRRRGPQVSTAESRLLSMRLDHESGEMDGAVRDGPFEGRRLSEMTLAELMRFAAAIPEDDADSARLLEAYLDRAHPEWRGDAERGETAPPPSGDGMSRAEALDLLGLEAGAGRDAILAAHRRLMKRVHPDLGGSARLAAQINAAKDVLLRDASTN